MNLMLGHKTRNHIIHLYQTDNTMRLEINYKERTAKSINTRGLNNILLSNQSITEETKSKKYRRQKELTQWSKTMGLSKSRCKREFVITYSYFRKQNSEENNLILHLCELE